MHFDMHKPCDNCPFREDITFYLDPERTREILASIFEHDSTFTCHKTVHYDDDHWDEDSGHYHHTGDEQHCAGALIMAERLNRPNQLMRIMERLGIYDRTKLDMDAPVFKTPQAMIQRMQQLHKPKRTRKNRKDSSC